MGAATNITVEFCPAALRQIFIRRSRLIAAGIALIAFFPGVAPAATKHWDAGGAIGDWSDINNWDGTGNGTLPLATDDVVFDNSLQSPTLEDVFLNAPQS